MVYRYWICFLFIVLQLVACSPKADIGKYDLLKLQKKGDDLDALRNQSRKVQAVHARGWAKVWVNGKENPSLRTDILWAKDENGKARFKVSGYGPFSITVFEARYQEGLFSLTLPKDRAVFVNGKGDKEVTRCIERVITRLIFDPWGISVYGAPDIKPLSPNGLFVRSRVCDSAIEVSFKDDLTPVSLKIKDMEISYSLPHFLKAGIYVNDIFITVSFELDELEYLKRSEIEWEGDESIFKHFRVYPISVLLDEIKGIRP